jgi:hypothetical protein
MNEQKRNEHIRAANDLFKDCLIYISPTRDTGLQKEIIQILKSFSAITR